MELAEKIPLAARLRGLSLKQVAHKTGISYNTLRGYIAHGKRPLVRTGIALAKALDVGIEWLFDDSQGPPPPPVEEGRFAGPISGSLDRLAGTLAWLLAALVLVVPLAVPAGLAAWGAHRLRGRSDRRLMGSAS